MNKTVVILVVLLAIVLSGCVEKPKESGQVTTVTATATIRPAGKILAEAVPGYIIDKSSNYIKSYVGNDYFVRRLTLTDNKTLQSGTGEISYNVFYSYDIPSDYLASPNPKRVSVSLDKDGNIIDYLGPKKPHTFSLTREQVIGIARQNGLKEPVIAEIDRVLAGKYIDGYVWVVTGAIDETTCRKIGGTQECLIPGIYVDVDDGSITGTFNRSNLVRE